MLFKLPRYNHSSVLLFCASFLLTFGLLFVGFVCATPIISECVLDYGLQLGSVVGYILIAFLSVIISSCTCEFVALGLAYLFIPVAMFWILLKALFWGSTLKNGNNNGD